MYTPYSLRHFFASVLIAQNKDLKTIQEWMGHEDAAMTLNVYGHLIRLKQSTNAAEPAGILSQYCLFDVASMWQIASNQLIINTVM